MILSLILSTVALAIPALVTSSSFVLYGRFLNSLSESSLANSKANVSSAGVALLMSTRLDEDFSGAEGDPFAT